MPRRLERVANRMGKSRRMRFPVGSISRLLRGNGLTAIDRLPWGARPESNVSAEMGSRHDTTMKSAREHIDEKLAEIRVKDRALRT